MLKYLVPLASIGHRTTSVLPDGSSPQVAADAANLNCFALKIHGWETDEPTGDEAFVRINRSWRASWR